jgi:hypothetical protein
MYKEIFGSEDAWVVYKAVRTLYYEKEKKERRNIRWVWGELSLCITANNYDSYSDMLKTAGLLALAIVFFVISAVALGKGADIFPAMLGIWFGLLGMITAPIFIIVECRNPEGRAETELQGNWHKAGLSSAPSASS